MLKVISLNTINEIFETEATEPLSPMAKMCYIQCLLFYFKDKEPTLQNCSGFDLLKSSFKAYNVNYFNQLRDAGLVIISEQSVTFINHWNRHIDKALLNKVTPSEYLAMVEYKSILEFEDNLYKNEGIFEILQAQHGLKPDQALQLVKLFITNQKATEKMYHNVSDCYIHCINWSAKNAFRVKNAVNKGNKVLGKD